MVTHSEDNVAGKSHILYVDDESENLTNFNYLFDTDYQIAIAESAAEGLEILQEIPFKVVIADQIMPILSGIEFLEKVALQQPDIIRILMTGYTDIDLVITAINRGEVYRYVGKPWQEDELRAIINSAIDLYDLKRQNKEMMASLEKTNAELEEKNLALEEALAEIRTLRGIIPICSYCHNIRDDEGAWNRLESYISKHSDAQFSHGICPACLVREVEKLRND